ncbi:hypothetical protein ACIA59_28635 [Micromonospora haikouensis]|uniref:hypothetical protein n=1 Tax=Micromonospora haikouensis TaxID=686309 RepID=UPI0037B41796
MRLLVHVAGESDLLLGSHSNPSPDRPHDGAETPRAQRVEARRAEIGTILAAPGGASVARRRLTTDGWPDGPFSTPAPSPLLGVLDHLDATPDLDVVVLGTGQTPPDPLDTLPIARTLVDVLERIAVADDAYPVRTVTALPVAGLTERSVVDALGAYLGEAPQYRQTLVTWGSGATAVALGTLTALSRVGLPWHLVLTSDPSAYQIVNPLDRLDVDPVAGVFVRWRMFAALDELARTDPPAVPLTDAQHDLVRQAADRHRAGFEARDSASLRAVLADAVVRRDGTASLAVRRYVTRRYEELLAVDKVDHPWAEDLFLECERRERRATLGRKLAMIKRESHSDPLFSASTDLPSYKWLYTPEVDSLQSIGRGSHNLCPPAPQDARVIGDYLSRYNTDRGGWLEAGLPEPPVTPADTVLAVWLAGVRPAAENRTVGQQLLDGLPEQVSNHLGVEDTRLRAVIFGVDDGAGSRQYADAEAALIGSIPHAPTGECRGEAWVEAIETPLIDAAAVEQAIESRLTRETGALLLIPTGIKPVMLALLRALRRIGARHGLPLFVRQTPDRASHDHPGEVYLWPALTGGDLPLLNAAMNALRTLELDVAWRLLAASAIDPAVSDKAQQLAATFASRRPLRDTIPVAASDRASWTTRLIAARLGLVDAALAYATSPSDRIRLLVLAADALEASVAATQTGGRPGAKYGEFREKLVKEAKADGKAAAGSARVLLLLNEARDRAPITHGTSADPDAIVADAADQLAAKHSWTGGATQPRDVPTLLRDAVTAAVQRGLGRPDRADILLRLHEEIIEDIDAAIRQRAVPDALGSRATR